VGVPRDAWEDSASKRDTMALSYDRRAGISPSFKGGSINFPSERAKIYLCDLKKGLKNQKELCITKSRRDKED